MAGRVFGGVILLLAVGAWAGDQTPDTPGREAGEHARPAESAATARRRMLYHLPEGSEIFPLDWLLALKSAKTGKPFLEDPERFGLIPDPETLDIPGLEGREIADRPDHRHTPGCARRRRRHQASSRPS